jgi:hypothetical protein
VRKDWRQRWDNKSANIPTLWQKNLEMAVELEVWKNPKPNEPFGPKGFYPFCARRPARLREKDGYRRDTRPEKIPRCLTDGPMAFQPGEK